jgi:hypothetical protein
MAPLATRDRAETREMRQAWEAMAPVPETARAAPTAAVGAAKQVPEPAQVTPVVVAKATSLRTTGTPVGSIAGLGGSRRARRFITARRESQL